MFEKEELEGTILRRKWLIFNEVVACKIIITCTKAVLLRNTGKQLCEMCCKWKNKTVIGLYAKT